MLTGLNSFDWDNSDIPALVRGLLSEDSTVRAHSLTGLRDAPPEVVPFLLELATVSGLPGVEGILDLLTDLAATGVLAGAAVQVGHTLFLLLLDDKDPRVRAAAARALTVCTDYADESLPVLRRCFELEDNTGVRLAMLAALPEDFQSDVDDPTVRLALAARRLSVSVPPDVVRMVSELIDAAYRSGRPEVPALVRSVHEALGERRAERLELIAAELSVPDWERRAEAVQMSALLS